MNKKETGLTGETEHIANNVKDYLDLRLDAIKLAAVEQLSVVFSNALGTILCIVLGGMSMLFVLGILTYLLGLWIGSLLWAVVIVAVLTAIASVITIVFRQKLFSGIMVRMFTRIFFPEKTDL